MTAGKSKKLDPLIKGILIDVKNLTVSEVVFENRLEEFYAQLRCECITFAAFPGDNRHDIVVDDESLIKPLQNFFSVSPEEEYCGNGLIVQYNNVGDWISHDLDVEKVKKMIHFHKYIRINNEIFKINLGEEK